MFGVEKERRYVAVVGFSGRARLHNSMRWRYRTKVREGREKNRLFLGLGAKNKAAHVGDARADKAKAVAGEAADEEAEGADEVADEVEEAGEEAEHEAAAEEAEYEEEVAEEGGGSGGIHCR